MASAEEITNIIQTYLDSKVTLLEFSDKIAEIAWDVECADLKDQLKKTNLNEVL